jgi:tetratricopeptide (TPR) repeat protein
VGECYAEGGAPYAPFAQILRQALEDGAAPHDLPDFVLADLLELAPDLRLRFPAVPPNPPLDAQSVQARLFENVLTLCQALCQRGPLLLLLEDAHWADSGTLKLFHHLARRGRGMPLMLLSTYREVELDETLPMQALLHDLNRERLGVRIKLERLDENGTRDMLAALFDEEVTPEFLHAIYRETEGNPFFIEEVCKALVESGRLYYRDGRWQRPEVNELEIPQSVRVAIQSRVGQLPGAVQEILNIAAILGREFDYQTLAQASQAGEESLIEALEKAEDADLIQETSAREGVTFRFTHALIPDTLAGGIHTLRRRRMHQQAARAIEVLRPLDFEALAHHFVEAGDLQPAQIYHVRAGERAATAYANAEAEMHFQAALDLAGSDDERGRLLAELGRVRARMSRYELAIQDDLQAAELFSRLGDLDRAAGLYAHAALSAWDGGETERGLEIANQGLVRATPAQPGRGYAELLSEVGRAAYFNGQHEDSRKFCQQALRLGEELSLPGVQAGALITLGLLPGQAGEISIELLEKAARISEAAGLTRQAHRALHDLCVLSFDQPGKWREARQYGLRAAELARKRGALSDELHSWVTLAYSYILPGEYQALEPILDRMRELDLLIGGDTTGVRYAKYLEASLWHCRGELERASEALYSIQEAFRKTGDLQGLISLNKDLAEIHMEIGEFAPAETALREAIQVAESGIEPLAIPYHAALSQLLARQGRVDEARPLLELARHKKPDSDLVIWEALAIYAAAAELSAAEARAASAAADLMAEEECWGRAWQDYRWLAEYLEKLEMPWQRARTLREWAEAHLRRGSPQDVQQARLLLEEAGDIFAGLGVDYYARQVEERLKQLS